MTDIRYVDEAMAQPVANADGDLLHCPECDEEQYQEMVNEYWTCPNCGCEMEEANE